MKIVHISAESYPMAKVGGLADVVGALPKYQKKVGNEVCAIVPAYETKFRKEKHFIECYKSVIKLADYEYPFSILQLDSDELGYDFFLVSIPGLIDREKIYGYDDDIERFIAFQIATLQWICETNSIPTIVHCHDHHTGLIPFMMQLCFSFQKLENVKSVITIHNGLYQGRFGYDKLHYLPEFDHSHVKLLEWDFCINSLAVGVKCAHAVTTVSPSYLDEINHFANGLELLFQEVRWKSRGILNGIDVAVWDTETDKMLAENFSIENLKSGKNANKLVLCEQFNLNPDLPLFSFIGRLFEEKGGDLLPDVVSDFFLHHGKKVNFLILGSGRHDIEHKLKDLVNQFSGNYNTFIGYDEALAHLVYAGSDFLLMPSRVEPCGLNQMYSLRYGTIPIVRRTGGLQDTIIDFGDGGNGICHNQASVFDIVYSINRAINLFEDKIEFENSRIKAMQTDHSWELVCNEYIAVYQSILSKK